MKEERLPHNAREGVVFMLVISFLSVNTIAPLIMLFERGFHWSVYEEALRLMPFLWLLVIGVVRFIAGPIVGRLGRRFIDRTDSFTAQVTMTILLNVMVISIVMTLIGTWISEGAVHWIPLDEWFNRWFRNASLAFCIECFFAQPIARAVMVRLHRRADAR